MSSRRQRIAVALSTFYQGAENVAEGRDSHLQWCFFNGLRVKSAHDGQSCVARQGRSAPPATATGRPPRLYACTDGWSSVRIRTRL